MKPLILSLLALSALPVLAKAETYYRCDLPADEFAVMEAAFFDLYHDEKLDTYIVVNTVGEIVAELTAPAQPGISYRQPADGKIFLVVNEQRITILAGRAYTCKERQ